MALPTWVTNAINAITPVSNYADRTAQLGYHGAVQGIGNQMGFPSPTDQQQTMYPYFPGGDPTPVRRDLQGEQFRNQMQSELSPAASFYEGQVPVGTVFSDVADINQKMVKGQRNDAVTGDKVYASGVSSDSSPFTSANFTRPKNTTTIIHHDNGDNQGDPNGTGWDETVVTPNPDPSQFNNPMDGKQQNALKVALYSAILQGSGGIHDYSAFNRDLQTYIAQNPQAAQQVNQIASPAYNTLNQPEKQNLIWALLAAHQGASLMNTPMANHYQGIFR